MADPMSDKKPGRVELLELDIDIRLADLWKEMDDVAEWDLVSVAIFMRAAYGKGYSDALKDDTAGNRGELCSDHGYKIP